MNSLMARVGVALVVVTLVGVLVGVLGEVGLIDLATSMFIVGVTGTGTAFFLFFYKECR